MEEDSAPPLPVPARLCWLAATREPQTALAPHSVPRRFSRPMLPVPVRSAFSCKILMESQSNIVSLAVLAPNIGDAVITLTDAAPAATGEDIIVVEPTTAGLSVPGNNVDLDIADLGIFSVANSTSTLA